MRATGSDAPFLHSITPPLQYSTTSSNGGPMSKKHSMPEMKEGGVNVTPLIDIVMCLIIFFMLVAKIGVSTGSTPMDLPTTIVGKKIEQLGDNVILNVYDPNIEREQNQSEGRPLRDDKGQVIRT